MSSSTYPPFTATAGIAALCAALDAVPEGWAKINGQWVLLGLYGPVKMGDGQVDAYVPAESFLREPEVTPRIKQRAEELAREREAR